MSRQYIQTATWAKAFVIAFAFLSLSGITILIYHLFNDLPKSKILQKIFWLLLPLSLAIASLILYALLDIFKGGVLLTKNSISRIFPFSARSLKVDEIKGFYVNEKEIVVLPLFPNNKKLTIHRYFRNQLQILEWLGQNCSDLDNEQMLEDYNLILQNEHLGVTDDKRIHQLDRAKKFCKNLNRTTWILIFPVMFWSEAPDVLVIACMAYLIGGMALLYQFGRIFTLDEERNNTLPNFSILLMMPGLALSYSAIVKYNVTDYSRSWIPSLIFGFILSWILDRIYFIKRNNRWKNHLQQFLLFIFLSIYGFGSIIHLNGIFDQANFTVSSAIIVDKEARQGKSTSYYLNISLSDKSKEQLTVIKEYYLRKAKGDSLKIYRHHGALQIPWIELPEMK